jgi:rhamnopyranosyl-N-acetylglucosaminyl-diphospho-decaprenol beta-1,3/1,4-galactofuranosyltransferase
MDRYAAVVVTFNRCHLLKVCLEALVDQTRTLDAIIVIDNASTDETLKAVDTFAAVSQVPVFYRKLRNNEGGAGGFSFGARFAHSLGYAGVWLMDDDGIPASDALEQLLKVEGYAIRNSLVADIEDPAALAFPLEKTPASKLVSEVQALGPTVDDSVSPFNGTLVDAKVFETVGFPYEGFFIWGDEVEFISRAKAAGLAVCTVTRAVHGHPANRKKPYMMFGRFNVNVVAAERLAIYMRNYSYNLYTHRGTKSWLKFVAKQMAYELFIAKSPRRLATAISATWEGLFVFPSKVKAGVTKEYRPELAISTDWNEKRGAIAV